jgi:pimeloyl-ACP methyl ester carboxylesterase
MTTKCPATEPVATTATATTATATTAPATKPVPITRKVLFVCGFNPQSLCAWNTHYDSVRAFFEGKKGLSVEYFTYTWTECAESVYARLSTTLCSDKYDSIVAHSMGCTLTARYFARHPEKLASYHRVVLCMPLITGDNTLHSFISRVPFAGMVPMPTMLALPSIALSSDGFLTGVIDGLMDNCAYGIPRVFCGQQIVHAYREWIPKLDLGMLEKPNVHVLYATEDVLTVIANTTLARAKHLAKIEGKHEAFNARRSSRAFFTALAKAVDTDVDTAVAPVSTTSGSGSRCCFYTSNATTALPDSCPSTPIAA